MKKLSDRKGCRLVQDREQRLLKHAICNVEEVINIRRVQDRGQRLLKHVICNVEEVINIRLVSISAGITIG